MQSDQQTMSEEIIDTLDRCSEVWNHVYVSQRPWLEKNVHYQIVSHIFLF